MELPLTQRGPGSRVLKMGLSSRPADMTDPSSTRVAYPATPPADWAKPDFKKASARRVPSPAPF